MGVTICAKNSKFDFSGGYFGFMRLRQHIAKVWDKEFGEHYATLPKCFKKDDYDLFNKRANQILRDSRFKDEDDDVVDFFFQSDCDGAIGYKTCKKLYDIIKDDDTELVFTYEAWSDRKDYQYFKEFLLECYKHRRKMRWC